MQPLCSNARAGHGGYTIERRHQAPRTSQPGEYSLKMLALELIQLLPLGTQYCIESRSKRRKYSLALDGPCAHMLTSIYQDEQYLVRWNTDKSTNKPPLSWHSILELVRCLEHVQDYLEVREKYSSPSQ
jgi:hypothetical protein